MIISDAPNCGVTYNHHYDDRNSFIIQEQSLELTLKGNFDMFIR